MHSVNSTYDNHYSPHQVPNVRLGVARTMSLIDAETDYYKSNQPSEEGEVMTQEQAEERDDSGSSLSRRSLRIETVEMNLKNDSDADVRAFYGGSAKQYGQNVAGDSNLNDGEEDDEDDPYLFKDDEEEREESRDGAGEAAEAGGGDGGEEEEEAEERVVPDKWEEEAEEEDQEEGNRSDEKLGDKPDARPDEE